jgi:hypothetical protein
VQACSAKGSDVQSDLKHNIIVKKYACGQILKLQLNHYLSKIPFEITERRSTSDTTIAEPSLHRQAFESKFFPANLNAPKKKTARRQMIFPVIRHTKLAGRFDDSVVDLQAQ